MAAEEEADPVEPSSVPAWFREMVTDQRAGPFHQSELLYRQSLIADPCHAETWHLLGLIVHQAGHPEQGIAHLRQALALSPGNASYLHSLGSIYQEIGHYEQALPCFREVLRRDPTQLPAAQGLGMALKQVGRFDEALEVFGQILARDPLQPTVHNALGEVYQQLSRFPEALTHYRLASLTLLPFGRAHHDYLRLINYLPDWDADTAFDEHWLWGLKAAPRQPCRYPNPRDPERPLRIGYVSGDFRNHPRARFLASFLRLHNPMEFHVYLYAEVPRPDELTRQFQRDAPFWRNTVGQTPQEVARQIQSDAIDILIDLAGHHHYNRLDVFAQQPAPVQAAYLGYPNTTGLPAIDYWLTDSILLPPDAPIRTTEHPVYLPGASFCYEPPVSAPPVSPLPARRAGRITFGSNHDWSQLNDELLPLWTRILQGVPDSRLIFLDRIASPQATEWLRSRFQRLGLAPERIEVRQPTRGDMHDLTVYGELDLILDTFPFSGHASTCEALWMGVPVVTLKGERIASRLSAAVLAPLGLSDLITETPADYVERAQRLANDLDGLEELRQSLRRRMEPLCDGPRFTRQLEATYRQIWRHWCTGSSAEATSSARPRPSSLLKRESPRSNAPPKLTRLNRSRTIEIVVPVRPGGRDRFPIPDVPGRIKTRVQECADGNLSRLYRDAYLRSQADLVLLKHDDFGFEHWESFEMQMWDILTQHPILGVAGSRAFAPQRLPWWRQTAQPGFRDGLNRGMVSHPLPTGLSPSGTAPSYHQTLYGPPGPVAVLDGVLLAVIRRWESDTPYAGRFSHEEIASWWDESFGRHFYDMAFTFNASRAYQESGLKSACFAMVADVFHESVGTPDRAWQEAARLFVSRYGGAMPVRV